MTPEDPPHEAATAEDATPEDPQYRVRDVVDPAAVRRAPRYGRFLTLGALLGALVAAIVTIVSSGGDLSDRSLLGLMLLVFVPLGVLTGAVMALWLDRRSWRRRERRGQESGT